MCRGIYVDVCAEYWYNAPMSNYCGYCGKVIPMRSALKVQRRWCSKACQNAAAREKYRQDNPIRGRNRSATGAMSELYVCADLLGRGYDVFRAVAPSCSCDLAVLIEGVLCRIEVKTAYKGASALTFNIDAKQIGKHDILALVHYGQDTPHIEYHPEIRDWLTTPQAFIAKQALIHHPQNGKGV